MGSRESFCGSSAGKESSCNAGDLSSIPGSGRALGESIGYPLQYSWASPVAQMVKNPPAMRKTWVRSLDWKDPLKEDIATHFGILAWRILWTEEPGGLQSMGSQRVRQTEQLSTAHGLEKSSFKLSKIVIHTLWGESYQCCGSFLC